MYDTFDHEKFRQPAIAPILPDYHAKYLETEGFSMRNYANKFNMTPEQSLFLAKKKWDENVYCGMRMEARNITFPQTKTILQGVNVPNVQLDDIQAVLNMRDAWRSC